MGLEGLTEAEHVEEEVVEKEEVKHMFQVIFWIHLYVPSQGHVSFLLESYLPDSSTSNCVLLYLTKTQGLFMEFDLSLGGTGGL